MSTATEQLLALREKVIAEPHTVLDARDRVNLRTLMVWGPAMKVRGFYMLDGRRYSYKSLHRFEILKLATEVYRSGKGIFLELTADGLAVAASITPKPSSPSPDPTTAAPSRRYWLDN